MFSVLQHLVVDSLPHTRAREGEMRSLFSTSCPQNGNFVAGFCFLGSQLIFSQINRTHLFHRLVFCLKKNPTKQNNKTLWLSRGIFWKRQICSFWKENLLCSYSLFDERNALTNCRRDPAIDFFHSGEHETSNSARKTGTDLLCAVQSS